MSSDKKHAALETLWHALTEATRRVKMPVMVVHAARVPLSWQPPPHPEQIAQVSWNLAEWLGRRGPPPSAAELDILPLIIAEGRTTFVHDTRIRDSLAAHLERESRPRALLRLIDAYFQSDDEVSEIVAQLIVPHLARHQDTAQYLTSMSAGLFAPQTLPTSIAARIVALNGDAITALAEFGVEMSEGALPLCRRTLSDVPKCLMKELINSPAGNADMIAKSIIMLDIANLLEPKLDPINFINNLVKQGVGEHAPRNRAVLRNFAVALLGDTAGSSRKWSSLEPSVHRLLGGWSPKMAINLAFELTGDHDELAVWKRDFWLDLVDRGVVDEATLVAGGPVLEQSQPSQPSLNALKFVARAVDTEQATIILLMRVGKMVVGESSPRGSCRVWFEGNRDAPAFGQLEYNIRQLRSHADYEQAHRGSKRGIWQAELSSVLGQPRVHIPSAGSLF